jgi:hypothetical protein
MPGAAGVSYARVFPETAEFTTMCRKRFAQSLFAAAVLAVPIGAAPGQGAWPVPAPLPAAPEPPLLVLLGAGLALGLARGKGGLRRPVRRRPG